MLEVDDAEQ